MLKRECGAEKMGSYHSYSIPGKTAALVPEFAVEDLPSAELQWRTCSWAQYFDDDYDNFSIINKLKRTFEKSCIRICAQLCKSSAEGWNSATSSLPNGMSIRRPIWVLGRDYIKGHWRPYEMIFLWLWWPMISGNIRNSSYSWEKTRINLDQENRPDRGSNPGPLRGRQRC